MYNINILRYKKVGIEIKIKKFKEYLKDHISIIEIDFVIYIFEFFIKIFK